MLKHESIGIVIPVYNEERNIESLLAKILSELREADHTICIVDDGSKDNTVSIINKLMENYPQIHLIQRVKTRAGCQRGGASLHAFRWLLENTTHEVFSEVDADGAHRPEELLTGVACISALGFDVAVASKYLYSSVVLGRTLSRRFISAFYSMASRILFNFRIRDYSNSFRFYSRRAIERVLLLKPRYTSPIYLLEIMAMLISSQFRILEIPTEYVERDGGESKVKWIDLVKGLFSMFAIAIRFHLKKYEVSSLTQTAK